MTGEYKTEEQYQTEHVQHMGEALGALFNSLYSDLVWVHIKWAEYVELFGTKPERVDLLNSTAPNFFGIMQGVLFENIILHVARLTDPPRSSGKRNLTIRALPAAVSSNIVASIDHQITEALKHSEFCRDWRDRHIAHNDLALALGQAAPLKDANRENLRSALHAIGDVLNVLSGHYGLSPTAFEHTIPGLGGAQLLLEALEAGILTRKNST